MYASILFLVQITSQKLPFYHSQKRSGYIQKVPFTSSIKSLFVPRCLGLLYCLFLAVGVRLAVALPFLVAVVRGAGLGTGWLLAMKEQSGKGP